MTTEYVFLDLDAILMVIVMIFLLILIIALYLKLRVWVLIMVVFAFNIIFAFISFDEKLIPFTPYFQLFFMLISGLIFLITSLEAYQK
jgi:hypothetical protein